MDPSAIFPFVLAAGAIAAGVSLSRQVRKPTWWAGNFVARSMNRRHSDLTAWGLDKARFSGASSILDVGCGGGQAIQVLAGLAPGARLIGVDYASASVHVAAATNANLIASHRVAIASANVGCLPLAGSSFDAATAIETHYYWPDVVAGLREIRRVLRPGGFLVVIAEVYRREGKGRADAVAMRLVGGRLLSADEHRNAFLSAGFSNVRVDVREERGWICVTGERSG